MSSPGSPPASWELIVTTPRTFVLDTSVLLSDPHAMLRFASACGALTVTRQGSFSAMPRGDEVLAFMEQQA